MTEIIKPTTLNSIWAVAGGRVKPDESKIQRGWVVEIPFVEYENWLTNRQDTAIAHFNQRGIAEWDWETLYILGKSYVQGSDGKVYRAKTNNRNKNPVSGTDDWVIAFVATDDTDSQRLFNGYIPISQSFTPQVNTRYYALSSLTLVLPTTAKAGDNVVVNKAGSVEVTVRVLGGGLINTKVGRISEVIYDIDDEVNFLFTGSVWQVA